MSLSSLDKVAGLIAGYTGPPDPASGPVELTVRTIMATGLVNPADMLPQTAGELDELLDYLASECLRYRSDAAEPPHMTAAALDRPDIIDHVDPPELAA